VQLQCKDEFQNIIDWPNAQDSVFKPWKDTRVTESDSPLSRIAELFNVNHFIVSQARPYMAPFLRSDFHAADPRQEQSWRISLPIVRVIMMEIQHRLTQLDTLGLLPASVRRFLLDENIPGASLLIVPELHPKDFLRLLENPNTNSVAHWIRRGERSVWPAVGALRVRCTIEVELDKGYQLVRRRKPFDVATPRSIMRKDSAGSLRRKRASSFGVSGPV
jgi:TAG lipase / lysophosphatidylethanolamine acyltransferase